MAKKTKGGTIKIRWVRSGIGATKKQRQVVLGLGLRRLGQVVERADTPAVRGMVEKIPHMVQLVNE